MSQHTYTVRAIEVNPSTRVVTLSASSSDPRTLPGRYWVHPDGTMNDWRRNLSKRATTLREALAKGAKEALAEFDGKVWRSINSFDCRSKAEWHRTREAAVAHAGPNLQHIDEANKIVVYRAETIY